MRYFIRMTIACTALLTLVLPVIAGAQTAQYHRDESWVPIPEVSPPYWEMNGAAVDRAGRRVYATRRFDPPIIEIDGATGKILNEIGSGLLAWPHGIFVDHEGFIWAADATVGDPPSLGLMGPIPIAVKAGRGHQVFKLTTDGDVVMTLGTAGVPGEGSNYFNGPSGVAVAPNGDIWIVDGHRGGNNRLVRFSKDGKFIRALGGGVGSESAEPGRFNDPHDIAIDAQGRIFVADRGNNRTQIFDQDGNFIAQWTQFGRPSGIFIDANDIIYVGDGMSNAQWNPGWERGIRIGDAKTGWVTSFIPDPEMDAGSGVEFLAVDGQGNIYAGEVGRQRLVKYVRVRP